MEQIQGHTANGRQYQGDNFGFSDFVIFYNNSINSHHKQGKSSFNVSGVTTENWKHYQNTTHGSNLSKLTFTSKMWKNM